MIRPGNARYAPLLSSVLMAALLACGGDAAGDRDSAPSSEDGSVQSTDSASPEATIGSGVSPNAASDSDPCSFLDRASVEALIGAPVEVRADTEMFKSNISSGVQCSLFGLDADADFVGGITLYRFDDDAEALRVFESDVVEFGDSPCYDGAPGGHVDVDVVGAARSVIVACGYTMWSVAGSNFVVVGVWPADERPVPDADQLAAFTGDVHSALGS